MTPDSLSTESGPITIPDLLPHPGPGKMQPHNGTWGVTRKRWGEREGVLGVGSDL